MKRVPASQLAPLSDLERGQTLPRASVQRPPGPSLAGSMSRFLEALRVERLLSGASSRSGHPYRAAVSTPTDDSATRRASSELRQAFATRMIWLAGACAILVAFGIGTDVLTNRRMVPEKRSSLEGFGMADPLGAPSPLPEPTGRFLPQPASHATDLNGDGVADFLVIRRVGLSDAEAALSAHDGKTLRWLWLSPPRRHYGHSLPVVVTKNRIFFSDSTGLVSIHRRDGNLVSESQHADALDICRLGTNEGVWIQTGEADGHGLGVTIDEDGRDVPTLRPRDCTDLPRWRKRPAGFVDDLYYQRMGDATFELALGFDPISRARHATRVGFVSRVPTKEASWDERYFLDGDEAGPGDLRGFEIDAEYFYFAYELESGARRIGARWLATGKVEWSTISREHNGARAQGLITAPGRLLVVSERHLELLSTATGERLRFAVASDAPD